MQLKQCFTTTTTKSLKSCPTLCDPIDGSPPGSPIPGILQARTLEWVAISFSNAWKWKVKVKLFSHVRLLVTPWTAAHQAPPSMGYSRQEYWSGVPLPSPRFPLGWLNSDWFSLGDEVTMQSFSPFSHPSEGKVSFPHILKLSFDMLLVSPSQAIDTACASESKIS